ncbi:DUF551 domain-containing protein [Escherichia coli]|uniref:DUF551 domain-containing protein n=1 Tax=Escherichia coli TaxID=562 RepID=UPI00288A7E46|nr:DUF551 domain-containing protein [Escherichia coli]
MFSHPVYLFLRKFSLQDSRGGSKSYGWTECDTFEGYYDWSRNKWWAVTDNGEEPASKVTHWMPLPEPPQEVNRG